MPKKSLFDNFNNEVRLRAITVGEQNGRFYVEFDHVMLIPTHRRSRRGVNKPPFLARENAQVIMKWANNYAIKNCLVGGNKVLFDTMEDAILCRVAFA